MKKEIFNLGQYVIRYKAPQEIVNDINKTFDNRKNLQLKNANRMLAGKIKNEFTLYDSFQSEERTRCNYLSPQSHDWLIKIFKDYLDTLSSSKVGINLSFVWVNEMKSGEYNPVHYHSSAVSFTGLSSVMILKLPKNLGKEYSPGPPGSTPTNGALEFISSSTGQFCNFTLKPTLAVGDMYVFPYDLRHTVYPFNNNKEKRRTLAANADTFPIGIKPMLK